MARMQVGTGEFNVVVEGPDDAPAVLLSNSLGTTLHMWDEQAEALKQRFRVVRYDSRGHGDSVVDAGPYTIEQLGRDALAILDALKIDKAHYVGLSKGGMVGLWLLTHAPDRIGRAVLANTSAYLGPPDLWNTRIRTAQAEGMKAIAAGTMDRWFSRAFHEKAPQSVEAVARMFAATPLQGYVACCAALRDMDQRETIRAISKPVLVIVGTQDPATPPAMGGLIADHIEGARLVALDAAHLSNIEAANAFNRAILSFLSAAETKAKPPEADVKAATKRAAKPATETKPAKQTATRTPKTALKKAASKKAKTTKTKTAKKRRRKAPRSKQSGKSRKRPS